MRDRVLCLKSTKYWQNPGKVRQSNFQILRCQIILGVTPLYQLNSTFIYATEKLISHWLN